MKKYCPNCGHTLTSTSEFCPNCGKKITKEPIIHQSRQTYNQQNIVKKSHKGIIALIAIILIVVGGGVAFYFSSNQNAVQDVTAKVTSHSKTTSTKSGKLSVSELSDKQRNAAVIVYASMKYNDKNWQRLLKNGKSNRIEATVNSPHVVLNAENNRNDYTDYTIQPNRKYLIFSFKSTLGESSLDKMIDYINDHNYESLVNQLSKHIVIRSVDDD
ncbi:zinc ribbon domain-containing protein [Lactobacillus gasseri]|uniref:zinc ribbon domain-containing protein n=1 Tax=Lactobacillus gasseri TaxID=1596 RepID=UPI00119368F9|nr:zinc ribbon domain-containing protein [Lactobacillus gasseri]TVU92739.1 zinc ribbon domain-containing protein [Lactobacillus gasseri]TVV16478.1 zinc ribbon domain-containing protein [Lactobacillus gasseri]